MARKGGDGEGFWELGRGGDGLLGLVPWIIVVWLLEGVLTENNSLITLKPFFKHHGRGKKQKSRLSKSTLSRTYLIY